MASVPGRFSFRRRSNNFTQIKTIQVQPGKPDNDQATKLTNASVEDEQYYQQETEYYRFPYYFKVFQNVAFTLCLLPFRISHSHSIINSTPSSVKVCRIFFQYILAALIHIVILVRCFLTIGATLTIKLRTSPIKLFEVLSAMAHGGLVSAFVYTGWRKQQSFKNLGVHFKVRSGISFKSFAILLGISIIPFLQYSVTIYKKAMEFDNNEKLQDDLSHELWIIWARNSSERRNNGTEIISDPLLQGFGYASLGIYYFLIWFVRISADILVFIAALSIREIAVKYLKLLQLPDLTLETLSNLFLKMEMQIEMVNNCTGPIVLGWFTLASLFFLETFFQMFSKSDPWLKGLNFLVILHNVITIWVAASAHNKALECKSIILEKGKGLKCCEENPTYHTNSQASTSCQRNTSSQIWSPAFVAYMELSETHIGVRGSEFFVISNIFIGGMVNSLVTYLLIMLQFNLDIAKEQPKN